MFVHVPFRLGLSVLVVSAGVLIAPTPSHAVKFGGVARLGFDFGGDTMVTTYFVGGGSEKIRAGDGMVLAGGLSMMNDGGNYGLETTIGWKNTSIEAENQTFDFTRIPIDLIAHYNFHLDDKPRSAIRVGVGATLHKNAKFKAKGSLANGSISFDDAVGTVAQVDYLISDNGRTGLSIGFRYTSLEYSAPGGTVDGSSAGLYIGGNF